MIPKNEKVALLIGVIVWLVLVTYFTTKLLAHV